jgi:hypothetical protein
MQFYVLEHKVGATFETTFLDMEPSHTGEGKDRQACPVCGEHVGMLPWLPPYRAEIKAYGKALGDVAFGPGNDLLVSAQFRAAWEATKLRGLEFAPIERLRIRPARLGKKPVSYYQIAPRRFGTRVDLQRSLVEYNNSYTCTTCFNGVGTNSVRGFKIDESSWTGEDIFKAWGMFGRIIVSERVKKLSEDYGLTNVTLIPTEEEFWDPYYRWSVIDYSRDDIAVPDEEDDCTAMN